MGEEEITMEAAQMVPQPQLKAQQSSFLLMLKQHFSHVQTLQSLFRLNGLEQQPPVI